MTNRRAKTMRSHESSKPDRLSVIIAVCYLVTLLVVMGIAFWFTQMLVIELGQWMKLVYPRYAM